MAKIVWLASYPKSGNTWLRALLANYQSASDKPADINALGSGGGFTRTQFDAYSAFKSSCLGDTVSDCLRPAIYRALIGDSGDTILTKKIHDAWRLTDRGEAMFPADATAGVIYVMRNVLDVASSAAHHWGVTMEDAVTRLCDDDLNLAAAPRRLQPQLRQTLRSWSGHIRSWLDESGLPVHLVRYEDMLADTTSALTKVVTFCGLPLDTRRLESAVANSRFEVLREQEREGGFREHSQQARGQFFRKGKAGNWQAELSPAQVGRLIDAHGDMMRRFGYIDEKGNPAG